MTKGNDAGTAAGDFVISRTFDAPRDLVFKVFTDPDHMKHWWGPKGFTVFHSKMNLKPGGFYHFGMRAPDGAPMWGKFIYREIVAPERIVYVHSFSDEDGNVARHPLHLAWPLTMLATVLFDDVNGKTKLTIRWTPLDASAEECKTFADNHDSMRMGWGGTFDQLAAYLKTARG